MVSGFIDTVGDSFVSSFLSEFVGDIEVGKVVQVVNSYTGNVIASGTTGMPNDDSKPQITEGVQVFSVPYTALSGTNTLLVFASASFGVSTSGVRTRLAMFDTLNGVPADSIAVSASRDPTGNGGTYLSLQAALTANTISARTFTFRIAGDINVTITLNGIAGTRRLGGAHSSGVTIIEVEP